MDAKTRWIKTDTLAYFPENRRTPKFTPFTTHQSDATNHIVGEGKARGGMRNIIISILVLGAWFSAHAAAQGPDGYEAIYDEPTSVNLGGRPVSADIAFYVDRAAAEQDDLRLALVTDVTKFVEETESDLENWVAAHQQRCGERWSAGDPLIDFPSGAIRFALYLEYEMWNCGWNGKGKPGRFAHEAGKIDVTLEPFIINGHLQARLGDFTITERSGVSKYLPLEFVTRRVLTAELKKLNNNPKFYKPPQPLYDEGFRYESITAQESHGRVIITARYKATGPADKFDRLLEKIRQDGITSEAAKPQ